MKETGQVGKFLVAIIVLVPLLGFIVEILKPGSVFNFIGRIWIWVFVLIASAIVILIVKNKIEGANV